MSTNKPEKVSEVSDEERIDLSAGFVPKNTSAAGEPESVELTPDSWMEQHGRDVDLSTERDSSLTGDSFVPDGVENGTLEQCEEGKLMIDFSGSNQSKGEDSENDPIQQMIQQALGSQKQQPA